MTASHMRKIETLWPHQANAIARLREALAAKYKRPLLQLPTGAGKTVTAAQIIIQALEKQRRVIFTVPAISLIDQTAQSFWAYGIRDIGVIQAQHHMTDARQPVQICSVQSLANRQIPEAHLVIIDEAHRKFRFLVDWMSRDEWASVPFIGLTATPWARGLGRLFDTLIIGSTIRELMDAGVLCQMRAFVPSIPDLSQVRKTRDGTGELSYVEGDLAKALDRGDIIGEIVETWLEKAEGRPTLLFAVNRAHAAHLADEFERAGVRCGYVDKDTPLDERERIRIGFHNGSIKVVANVGVLTTGTDWDVRCIILARSLRSEMLYVQIVGRGLRTAAGKDYLLFLDHSGTVLQLGLPADIHHEKLSQGKLFDEDPDPEGKDVEEEKDESREPKATQCPNCKAAIPRGARACPGCGTRGFKEHGVASADGELVEVTEALEKRKAKKDNKADDWGDKVAFIGELKAYANVKGKSDGWVANKYREKYSVWPNDPRVRNVRPAEKVSPKVAAWIKSRNVAYAKSKDKAGAR